MGQRLVLSHQIDDMTRRLVDTRGQPVQHRCYRWLLLVKRYLAVWLLGVILTASAPNRSTATIANNMSFMAPRSTGTAKPAGSAACQASEF